MSKELLHFSQPEQIKTHFFALLIFTQVWRWSLVPLMSWLVLCENYERYVT